MSKGKLEITNVRVHILEKRGRAKTLATASITIDDSFVIHGIKIVEGKGGLFVAMPRKKSATREATDIVHPTKTEVRREISKVVLDEYYKIVNKDSNM